MRFGAFCLDPSDRRLSRGGQTVELNARYMDALILLVEAGGDLVTKDRFMDEVWRGVPVTDEALTQAIRTLRRALGDSAGMPQYIETVPKHGYRFIAPVEPFAPVRDIATGATPSVLVSDGRFIRLALAGTAGAMLAGALIGLLYGFIGTTQPQTSGGGAVSLLIVLVLVSVFSAGVAGAGIAAGLAAALQFIRPWKWYWTVAGGMLGGVIVGAFANLIGSDAFRLLFGRSIGEFAGAFEGLVLGGAVGLAAFLARDGMWRSVSIAAVLGAGAGLLIALLDGRMMAGSLLALVDAFPSSQFRLDAVGRALGEAGLGPVGLSISAAAEGALFSMGVVRGLSTAAQGQSQAEAPLDR